MSKRRIRRKRRARVKILPLILVGVVIAGAITVIMSVNLKGADKEPPTEEIYITETLQAPQAENTEPVTKTEQEAVALGAIVRNVVNDQLLRLSYKDPKNIKRFLRNWGGLEGLSEKGDTVATCILTDLKTVTAIDLDKYHKSDRAEFNKAYRKGKLSHYQYMSIAYVLVLGYTQDELAFVMGVDQSVISKNINSGIKRIQRELRAYLEED